MIASFDLCFEARQHALGSDRRFLPDPLALGISGSASPKGTHMRFGFRLPNASYIHLPVPLRSTPVTALLSSYEDSDSSAGLPPAEVSPLHVTRHSEPFCLQTPHVPPSPLSHATPQLDGFPLTGSGLHHWLAGSPGRQAESSSSACGLVPHLQLLPTPPRGDAVTFGFQAGERIPGEDLHLYTCALAGAPAQGIALGRDGWAGTRAPTGCDNQPGPSYPL